MKKNIENVCDNGLVNASQKRKINKEIKLRVHYINYRYGLYAFKLYLYSV